MRLFSLFLLLVLCCQCAEKKEPEAKDPDVLAQEIHSKVITIDTHDDINVANFTDSVNYTQRLNTQINLPKMEEGGLDVAWLIVYTGQDTLSAEGYQKASENAMSKFEAIHRLCEEFAPDQIGLATTSQEVREIHASGRKVAMIGVENAYPMGEDIENFERYYEMGARYVSLAHNGHSQFSDSNTGEADSVWLHNGLSELGIQAVSEMNRLGIMIDLSHPSKKANMQMLELSKAPVIASHSSARALCNHSRNMDDELLMALKENGGVIQTVAFASYLNEEKSAARAEFLTELRKKVADSLDLEWYDRSQFASLTPEQRQAMFANWPRIRAAADELAEQTPDAPPGVDVSDFVDHIDYLVDLIGIDHVGISSDFDGGGGIVGWSDASETLNVTKELVARGYTEEQIAKLWGENLLRVLDEVQAYAQSQK